VAQAAIGVSVRCGPESIVFGAAPLCLGRETRIKVSYHVHSQWSDGVAPISEMLEAAKRARLDEIGISDHLVISPPGLFVSWEMPQGMLDEYVAQLRAFAEASKSPVVRVGIEADYFPETIATAREVLARHTFDYIIGSVHFVNGFPIDGDGKQYSALTVEGRCEVWRTYWIYVRQMAESRIFDIAAHLDLPKKFGHYRNAPITQEMRLALDAISAADMAIEINTAGWSLPAKEAYPSLAILQEARARNIPLLISADAHHPKTLTRDFDRARDLARKAGYTEVARFANRQRASEPL
jgi:histidinol-phosphatase (PHP family)